jgi:hypothetical protein
MEIRIDASAKRVFLKFDLITPEIQTGIANANREAKILLTKEKDKQILDTRSKTGVIYLRTKALKGGGVVRNKRTGKAVGFPVRRSAAGETPTEEGGAYRKSFDFIDEGKDGFVFGTTSTYGGFLEYGTSKMAARSGLENMFNAVAGNLQTVYEKQISRAMKI